MAELTKEVIDNALDRIRTFSYNEKQNPILDKTRSNSYLDSILFIESYFFNKTKCINDIVEGLEKLTWYNDPDNECLMKMNDLIASAKDTYSTLYRQYTGFKEIMLSGVGNNELKDFRIANNELLETAIDLESRFFYLPKMSEFQETTKELTLLK